MSDTLAACLTPPGTGAIAVVAVRGPGALQVVQALFQPASGGRQPPVVAEPDGLTRLWLGKLAQDDVVLLIKQTEPVPWIELHCHGGREVVRLILEALAEHGVRSCSWQEWERHVAASPIQAEAAIQLAQARTVRTAAILLDQYHGAWERELAGVTVALSQGNVAEARRLLKILTARSELGQHLIVPWRVVVAGAPNVGKSSLVNAVAGFQRSIVSPIPGTTRDVVSTLVALDGWPVELVDTAGLRGGDDDLEAAGIHLAQQAATTADLCLWVVDGSTQPVWPSSEIGRLLLVTNKIDLPPAWESRPDMLRVSAQTGAGIAELIQALVCRLVPEPPLPGAGVPFSPECRQHLADLAGKLFDDGSVLGIGPD